MEKIYHEVVIPFTSVKDAELFKEVIEREQGIMAFVRKVTKNDSE